MSDHWNLLKVEMALSQAFKSCFAKLQVSQLFVMRHKYFILRYNIFVATLTTIHVDSKLQAFLVCPQDAQPIQIN